jgi:hypothetical protein
MRVLKFNEANLDLKELDKTSKSGGLRGDVLVSKIKDHDDISFKPNGKPNSITPVSNAEEIIPEITDDNGKYDSEKAKQFFKSGTRYDKVIQGEDDEMYQLNDIEKTSDFGSSGGASLGTADTRNVECIQCLFLALRQTRGEESITENDIDNLFDADGSIKPDLIGSIRVPIAINKDIISAYSKTWLKSFINTANAIFEVRPVFSKETSPIKDNILSRRRSYIFYQIGYKEGLTKAIIDKYRSFSETTGIPISKWTPSDVWAVHRTQHTIVISRINECKTLDELNTLIDTLFDGKILRGISLKKLKNIEKTSDVVLVLNKVTPLPNYSFNSVITSTNSLGSLGIKILANREVNVESSLFTDGIEVMDVRSFSGPDNPSDVSGEVMGDSARHGKVGLLRINKIIKKVNPDLDLVPTKEELNRVSDRRLTTEINRMNAKITELGKVVGTKGSITGRSRLISKYQSLKLAELLYDNPDDADDIIESIFYYAMSIMNDQFTCPKYVRII